MTDWHAPPQLQGTNLKVGSPVVLAGIWSTVVVLGCALAIILVDYPSVRTTAEFVVLVRNVAIMGAAAIALPVSLYTFWMKDRGFRMELGKAVREQLERDERIRKEMRQQAPILGNQRFDGPREAAQ